MSASYLRRMRRRLSDERGFTMLLALGVMLVVMLLTAAVFTAVQGDAALSSADLQGKQAYAAAQAGLQAYVNALNTNSSSGWWQTCSNDTTITSANPSGWVAMPGATTGVSYRYQPWITATGGTCSSTNIVGTLIDPTTGALRMEFTGKSGNQTRTIVAGFHTLSPLSYLWYTKYEKVDTAVNGSSSSCATFYYAKPENWWSSRPQSDCEIEFGAGDKVNGPMYTQDQFLIQAGASPAPQLGRPRSTDVIASMGPSSVCAFSNCQGAAISNPEPGASLVGLPTDNAKIPTDATNHGVLLTGTTTLTLNASTETATAHICSSNLSTDPCTTQAINLLTTHLIYVATPSGCTVPTYDPEGVTYQTNTSGYPYGCVGDLYVQGTYDQPLTLWAQDDTIVTGNLTNTTDTNLTGTTSPTGSATLGVVADQYVRVMHDGLTTNRGYLVCPTGVGNPNVTIDGAILTLAHSFFVDNYQCGGAPTSHVPTSGLLTIHGSLIQKFRGIVQLSGSGGYVKNYDYDDRLQVMLPPYLFDAVETQWSVFRETLCSPTAGSSNSSSCAYSGP